MASPDLAPPGVWFTHLATGLGRRQALEDSQGGHKEIPAQLEQGSAKYQEAVQ